VSGKLSLWRFVWLAIVVLIFPWGLTASAPGAERFPRPPEVKASEPRPLATKVSDELAFDWTFGHDNHVIKSEEEVTAGDSFVIACQLLTFRDRRFRLDIPKGAKPPYLVLQYEEQPAVARPLGRCRGLHNIEYCSCAFAVNSFLFFEVDLCKYFGKLNAGTYHFWFVWSAGDFLVDGPPEVQVEDDLVSPSIKITVVAAKTGIKEAVAKLNRKGEVSLVRDGKPALVPLQNVPTGSLTNHGKQSISIRVRPDRDKDGRTTFSFPLKEVCSSRKWSSDGEWIDSDGDMWPKFDNNRLNPLPSDEWSQCWEEDYYVKPGASVHVMLPDWWLLNGVYCYEVLYSTKDGSGTATSEAFVVDRTAAAEKINGGLTAGSEPRAMRRAGSAPPRPIADLGPATPPWVPPHPERFKDFAPPAIDAPEYYELPLNPWFLSSMEIANDGTTEDSFPFKFYFHSKARWTFRFDIPEGAEPPRAELQRENEPPVVHPLKWSEVQNVLWVYEPEPGGFAFGMRGQVAAHFGKLTPGIYRFRIVFPQDSHVVEGIPGYNGGDLKTPLVKINVRATSLDEAKGKLTKDKGVELVRDGKPVLDPAGPLPTGILTNRLQEPIYIVADYVEETTTGSVIWSRPQEIRWHPEPGWRIKLADLVASPCYQVAPGKSVKVVMPDWRLDSDGIYVYAIPCFLGEAKAAERGLYTLVNVKTAKVVTAITDPFTVASVWRFRCSRNADPPSFLPLGKSSEKASEQSTD